MAFDSITFWIFFAAAWTVWRFAPFTIAKCAALLMSLVFYGWWNPWYLVLILISAVVDFIAGRKIYEAAGKGNPWLILSLCCNLGLLAIFKYGHFAAENVEWLAELFKINFAAPEMSWVVPVGISFYTFQTMSYSLDIYRGRLKPAASFIDFFLYVAFFPQLVAGPIVRACELLPQFEKRRKLIAPAVLDGIYHIVWGLFMKIVIADNLANSVNIIYGKISTASPVDMWLATVYFSIQIFADFAGYSSIAIGLAYVMGLRFPKNFNFPYISSGLSEFWRRWHITLSSWLRDYLYIPLGGNRKGPTRTTVNLMTTMLLGGLWHGTSWTFVAWGALHGIGLGIERVLTGGKRHVDFSFKKNGRIGFFVALKKFFQMIVVYIFILVTWVFFRADNFTSAGIALKKMFVTIFETGLGEIHVGKRLIILVMIVFAMHAARLAHEWMGWKPNKLWRAAGCGVMLFLIFIVTRVEQSAFIYFQF